MPSATRGHKITSKTVRNKARTEKGPDARTPRTHVKSVILLGHEQGVSKSGHTGKGREWPHQHYRAKKCDIWWHVQGHSLRSAVGGRGWPRRWGNRSRQHANQMQICRAARRACPRLRLFKIILVAMSDSAASAPAPALPSGSHPLESSWTIWFDKKVRSPTSDRYISVVFILSIIMMFP